MSPRGHLITFEGIDGAGKKTQSAFLAKHAQDVGLTVKVFSFPRYDESLFARSITEYLNGRFGGLRTTPPEFAALLFAGDRFEAREELMGALRSVDLVICDRYVASNLAHQSARLDHTLWPQFQRWIESIEYDVYRVPKPDVSVYLDISVELAQLMITERSHRTHRTFIAETADLHECDLAYLNACREAYAALQNSQCCGKWIHISCINGEGGHRWISEIAEEVWTKLDSAIDLMSHPSASSSSQLDAAA